LTSRSACSAKTSGGRISRDVLVAAGSADHDAVVAQGVDHARRISITATS
jgi:hypothetical protein